MLNDKECLSIGYQDKKRRICRSPNGGLDFQDRSDVTSSPLHHAERKPMISSCGVEEQMGLHNPFAGGVKIGRI